MDEIARLTPTFKASRSTRSGEMGSVQWPCNDEHPEGMPIMHIGEFTRGKGKFMMTEYVPTDERTGSRFPLILTTGRILSQYNVGAQTRRTANVEWHPEDRLEINPLDAEQRGVKDGDWVRFDSRAGETALRALDHRPRGDGCRLHDVPPSHDAGQRHHHGLLGLGDQLPRVQGDGGAGVAVERSDGRTRRTTRSSRARAAVSLSRPRPRSSRMPEAV